MKEDNGRNLTTFSLGRSLERTIGCPILAVVIEVLLYVDTHFEKGCLFAKN